MKYMVRVLAIATVGVLLAGFSGNHDADAPLAVPVAGAAMPLPEGHPPVPGAEPVCPYRGLSQHPTPGSEPSQRADHAPIIST